MSPRSQQACASRTPRPEPPDDATLPQRAAATSLAAPKESRRRRLARVPRRRRKNRHQAKREGAPSENESALEVRLPLQDCLREDGRADPAPLPLRKQGPRQLHAMKPVRHNAFPWAETKLVKGLKIPRKSNHGCAATMDASESNVGFHTFSGTHAQLASQFPALHFLERTLETTPPTINSFVLMT